MTVREARGQAADALSQLGSARLDADVILKWILGVDETHLLFHGETELTQVQQQRLHEAVCHRQRGLAVCYITGQKEFYGLDFDVTRDVLPPKSDTELLVENTLAAVRQRLGCLSAGDQVALCDMCAGSGCVGVSVMSELEREGSVSLVLADISEAALRVAKHNAMRLLRQPALQHVSFVQSDLFDGIPGAMRFDVVVSNPPYIPRDEALWLLADGRGEPLLALAGDEAVGGDGLDVTRCLVSQAASHLKTGGQLILETGDGQAGAVRQLFEQSGFGCVSVSRDLAGKMRNVQGTLI